MSAANHHDDVPEVGSYLEFGAEELVQASTPAQSYQTSVEQAAVFGRQLGERVSDTPVRLRQRAAAFGRHLLAGALGPGRGVIVTAGLLSVLAWLLDAGLFLSAAASLGITLQLGSAVIIAAAGALATALPAAPGYVGTYDLAAAAVGAGLGLDPATAVALAAVVHVMAVVPIALAGAAALVSETVSGRSVRFFGAAADQQDG